ncbi:DUF4383 domain-containing protein [Actinophytocola xanthii]|uniref:Uncharacterized protein n=1 Tax=Actinophytocola xanthii TaxID=1912961 RepID=A0A1Q8CPC1_9PSEU|nr:DUF4383 domain-containing protein [Actinophytocola xanthii]OLF16214.1 hypothetical protein BU204_17730 [Actinophytocola xanthii]
MRENTGRLAVAAIAAVFVLAGAMSLAAGSGSGVVYLAFGVVGFAVVGSARGTRWFLIGGAVLYVLWHFVISTETTSLSLSANDWLNLWFAGSMIALACLLEDRSEPVEERQDQREDWHGERVLTVTVPVGPAIRPRRPRAAAGNRPQARRRDVYVA